MCGCIQYENLVDLTIINMFYCVLVKYFELKEEYIGRPELYVLVGELCKVTLKNGTKA